MEPVGERLRQAREERGMSLGEIAVVTKISVTALTALERNDLSRLPGGIFGRSFVRGYAAQVGLDPEAVVRDFIEEVAVFQRESARQKTRSPITPDDREFAARQRRAMTLLRRGLILLVVVALALVVWQVWVWRTAEDSGTGGGAPAGSAMSQARSSLLLSRARSARSPLRPHLGEAVHIDGRPVPLLFGRQAL